MASILVHRRLSRLPYAALVDDSPIDAPLADFSIPDDRGRIGGNGGPPLDDPIEIPNESPREIHFGAKYLHLFDRARHKAFYGGRGSGKSQAVAIYLVIMACQTKKRIVCARQFQNSLRDSAKELIEQKIIALGVEDQFRVTKTEIVNIYTGSRFTFIGLDRNIKSVKSFEGADIIWVEEAATVSLEAMEILRPTLRKDGSEFIWTWNPDRREDPVDEFFRGKLRPPNSVIVRVGIEDNPWFYQTAMPEEMWFMQIGNQSRYEHIWLGEYDDAYEGRIFKNTKIGRPELPDDAEPRYGIDFGGGTEKGSPTAAVKLYVLEERRILYIARESVASVPIQDFHELLDDVLEYKSDWVVGDSEDPKAIDYLRTEGYNVIGASKGPGSVRAGIMWLLGFEIWIDPECPMMQEEARLYSWKIDRQTKKVRAVPVKQHDHLWDAVRYATESLHAAPGAAADGGVIVVRS